MAEPLARDTTARLVANRLRDEIQRGIVAPGTRLRQNEIARRLGVSTTPVREAFAQLQAEGLVRIDPHRGAVVFNPTVEDLLEFYEIRELLESHAVVAAIPHLTDDIGRELHAVIERMGELDDPATWLELNDSFHLRLYGCAGRPRLTSLIEQLRDASTPYIYMYAARRSASDRANREHRAILDACLRGDTEGAEAAIRSHLRIAARELAGRETLDSPVSVPP